MYTSTILVLVSKDRFQTCSTIMARVTRRPALRIRYSSKSKFLGGQLDILAGAFDFAGDAIEFEVSHAQSGFDNARPPPQQRAHPGRQFGKGKRLDQAIVRAGVERLHAVFDPAAGGQHQDRKRRLLRTDGVQHTDTVQFGKIEVEDDEIVAGFQRHLTGQFAVGGYVDGVMFRLETLANKVGQWSVVFNDENTHRGNHYCSYFDCWRLGVVSSMMPRTFVADVFPKRESKPDTN